MLTVGVVVIVTVFSRVGWGRGWWSVDIIRLKKSGRGLMVRFRNDQGRRKKRFLGGIRRGLDQGEGERRRGRGSTANELGDAAESAASISFFF